MKEMRGERRRQACYGYDQGGVRSYTRLTSAFPKTLRTYHRHSAPAISGQYLCAVRAGQYWRLENLKSFGEFLEKRFPESRLKAAPPNSRWILPTLTWSMPKQECSTAYDLQNRNVVLHVTLAYSFSCL